MAAIGSRDHLKTAEKVGRDILRRAMSPDGGLTREEAERLHRAIGWPPPQIEDGVLRPPTPEEISRWNSLEPELIASMEWPELGVELEYRSQALFNMLLASARQTVGSLRAIARGAYPVPIDPSRLELERILETGEATAAELVRAHRFLGWDAPRFLRGCLQPPTVLGQPVPDLRVALASAVDAWRSKIAPRGPEAL